MAPILADFEEYLDYMDAVDEGKDMSDYHFKGEVTEMPEQFNNWIEENRERIANAKSMPYFIKNNYVDGDVSKGLRWEVAEPTAKIKGFQQHHPTDADIAKAGGTTAYTQEMCGVSKEAAEKMNEAVNRYSLDRETKWDSDVRAWQTNGVNAKLTNPVEKVIETAEQCEKFISLSPKWDGGTTFRGLSVEESLIEKWKEALIAKTPINMRGMSSWSTDANIGKEYATRFLDEQRTRKALFICEGRQNGTSIVYLAKYPNERELLCSNNSRWYITKYEQKGGFDIFTIELKP